MHYFLDKTDISRHLRCFTDIKYVRKKRKKILQKNFSQVQKTTTACVHKKERRKKIEKTIIENILFS